MKSKLKILTITSIAILGGVLFINGPEKTIQSTRLANDIPNSPAIMNDVFTDFYGINDNQNFQLQAATTNSDLNYWLDSSGEDTFEFEQNINPGVFNEWTYWSNEKPTGNGFTFADSFTTEITNDVNPNNGANGDYTYSIIKNVNGKILNQQSIYLDSESNPINTSNYEENRIWTNNEHIKWTQQPTSGFPYAGTLEAPLFYLSINKLGQWQLIAYNNVAAADLYYFKNPTSASSFWVDPTTKKQVAQGAPGSEEVKSLSAAMASKSTWDPENSPVSDAALLNIVFPENLVVAPKFIEGSVIGKVTNTEVVFNITYDETITGVNPTDVRVKIGNEVASLVQVRSTSSRASFNNYTASFTKADLVNGVNVEVEIVLGTNLNSPSYTVNNVKVDNGNVTVLNNPSSGSNGIGPLAITGIVIGSFVTLIILSSTIWYHGTKKAKLHNK